MNDSLVISGSSETPIGFFLDRQKSPDWPMNVHFREELVSRENKLSTIIEA